MADVSGMVPGRRRMTARRRWRSVTRKLRELGSIGSALASTSHPYMAHIVPMRRCNLACTYCNEYDDHSDAGADCGDGAPDRRAGAAGDERDYDLGRRAAAASGAGPGDCADTEDGRDCGDDHERVPADAGADRAAEPGGARPYADFDRQRDAGCGVEEDR